MEFRKILSQLNIPLQCRKYGLSLWQCPQFLFLIMGSLIISSILVSYFIGTRYIADPEIVALITLAIATILVVLAFFIIQSFERLTEANRMKSEFVNIVSHQLRAPLSNLRWALEILMAGKVDSVSPKQLSYFKILKENSDRMRELLKDLLIIARIETARLPLKKELFALEKIVQELIDEFSAFAQASNVEIKFKSENNLPKILADPSQIKIVIENLLDNAIRYIKGKGKVEMRLEKRDKNLYFEIKDNGVGIPKRDQKYIFQKFFRAENILKYQTQGTGLGLYISKAILQRLGGKIGFKSKEGEGSTFWFILPIK